MPRSRPNDGKKEEVKRILLTCSGGPFYEYTFDMLENVTLVGVEGEAIVTEDVEQTTNTGGTGS